MFKKMAAVLLFSTMLVAGFSQLAMASNRDAAGAAQFGADPMCLAWADSVAPRYSQDWYDIFEYCMCHYRGYCP